VVYNKASYIRRRARATGGARESARPSSSRRGRGGGGGEDWGQPDPEHISPRKFDVLAVRYVLSVVHTELRTTAKLYDALSSLQTALAVELPAIRAQLSEAPNYHLPSPPRCASTPCVPRTHCSRISAQAPWFLQPLAAPLCAAPSPSSHTVLKKLRLAFEMAFELELSCDARPGRTAGRAESRPR
jgi:hypothetical protein